MRPGTLLDTAQLAGKKLMDLFKKSTLEDMRALSFEELTKMSKEYMDTTKKFFMWAPVIDNYLLKGTFTDVARANEIPDIPYMFFLVTIMEPGTLRICGMYSILSDTAGGLSQRATRL